MGKGNSDYKYVLQPWLFKYSQALSFQQFTALTCQNLKKNASTAMETVNTYWQGIVSPSLKLSSQHQK